MDDINTEKCFHSMSSMRKSKRPEYVLSISLSLYLSVSLSLSLSLSPLSSLTLSSHSLMM